MAMSGLPSLRYGRSLVRPNAVYSEDTGAADLLGSLSSAAQNLGDQYLEGQVEKAKKEGEKSVTRDADGNIVVQKPDYLFPVMNEAHQNAAELRYATETEKDIAKELSDAHFANAMNPEGFEAAVEGIRTGKMGKLPNADWAPHINDLIDKRSFQHLTNIRNDKFNADIKAAGNAIDATLQDNANDLYALAEQGQLQSEEGQRILNRSTELIRSKVGNPAFAGYSQAQADLDVREFKSALEVGAIVGQAEAIFKDPNAGPIVAGEWLKAQLNDPNLELSPETRARVQTIGVRKLNELSQTLSAETAATQDKNYTQLNLRAELGSLPLPELNAAYENGDITGAAHRSLASKVIQKTTEDVDLTEAMGRAANHLPMDPNNPTDRKAINKTYDSIVSQGGDPLETTVNMAKLNGVIPERPMSQIRAAALANDPGMAAQGLGLGRAVTENAPDALDRMPGGDAIGRDVEVFRYLTRDMGFSDEDAAARIIANRDPKVRAQAEARLAVARDEINKLTVDDAVEGMRSQTWAGWIFGVDAVNEDQSLSITNDYKAYVREHMKTGTDFESAQALARKDMARNYGSTMVEGSETLMKYPPERRYPAVDGSHDYIKAQAVETARALTGDVNLGLDDVHIGWDGVTANDWAKKGALPRYSLMVRQGDTWMTLPSGYFVADPKAAGGGQAATQEQFGAARETAKRTLAASKAAAAAPDIMSGFTSPETGTAKPNGAAKPSANAATGESRLHAQIKRDEQGNKGPALKPYKDSGGQSIGWGHFIKPGEEHLKKGITREQAEELFKQDVQDATNDLQDNYPKLWNAAETPNRREALINMMFNMGMGNKDKGFSSFTKSIPLMEQGRWEEAAVNLRKSKWYKQTGNRAKRVIKMLVEG